MQELSGVAMCMVNKNVVDVFHNYAYCPWDQDGWSRKHIHGLNPDLLVDSAYANEHLLIDAFLTWLSKFNVFIIYANNPRSESIKLGLTICDIGLPDWAERVKHDYHTIPHFYKMNNEDYDLNISCHDIMHSCYETTPIYSHMTPNQIAKAKHGWHCSLADAFELYLFYLSEFL